MLGSHSAPIEESGEEEGPYQSGFLLYNGGRMEIYVSVLALQNEADGGNSPATRRPCLTCN